METGPNNQNIAVTTEIKRRIYLLNIIAAIVTAAFSALIIYPYIARQDTGTATDMPLPLMTALAAVIILTGSGFYISRLLSRQIISSIEEYSSKLDYVLNITKDVREELYGDILLGKIMDYSLLVTDSDAGSILFIEGDRLVFKIVKGEKADELRGTSIPKDKGVAGWVAMNSKPLLVKDTASDKRFNTGVDILTGYRTKSMLCVPLMLKTGVIGVIEMLNRKGGSYTEEDEIALSYFADQAAISIERARFYEDQKNFEIHLTNMLLDSINYQFPERMWHSRRVAKYSDMIAKAVNLPEQNRKKLYLASLLHDIGFLKIKAEDIFAREEFIKHPLLGYEMISPINFYADIAPLVLSHHERYDGQGYPAGIKGEAIPIEARIIAIAETFDTMVSDISYKVTVSFEQAVEELRHCAGKHFDPKLVDAFINNIRPEHLR